MTQVRLARCDSCEKQVPLDKVSDWLSVQTVVATVEEFAARINEPAYHGDFCSLACLASWASNAAQLKGFDLGSGDASV